MSLFILFSLIATVSLFGADPIGTVIAVDGRRCCHDQQRRKTFL